MHGCFSFKRVELRKAYTNDPRVHFSIRLSARTKRCFPQKDETRSFVALSSNVHDAQEVNFAKFRGNDSMAGFPALNRPTPSNMMLHCSLSGAGVRAWRKILLCYLVA